VLPRCPEMPQLPQIHGCQDELPLEQLTYNVLPQPEPGQDEHTLLLISLAEGGLMMISLAWGVVAARIFKGDEDLATLRCSLAQQRSVTARISHDHGLRDLVTLRCSLAQQRSVAVRILQGQGDLATPRRCSWPHRGETHYYSWAEGGNIHHCSCHLCCSWAEGGETNHCLLRCCSWAEECNHLLLQLHELHPGRAAGEEEEGEEEDKEYESCRGIHMEATRDNPASEPTFIS